MVSLCFSVLRRRRRRSGSSDVWVVDVACVADWHWLSVLTRDHDASVVKRFRKKRIKDRDAIE